MRLGYIALAGELSRELTAFGGTTTGFPKIQAAGPVKATVHAAGVKVKKKGGMSQAQRDLIAERQRQRWAKIRAEKAAKEAKANGGKKGSVRELAVAASHARKPESSHRGKKQAGRTR